jgi:hypothetical protein
VLGLGSAVAGEDVLKGGGTMEVSTLEGAEGSAFEGSGAEGSALGGSVPEEGAARARAFAPADCASGLACLPDLLPAYGSVCMHAR